MSIPAKNHTLYWIKDAFSLNYSIYAEENLVGFIKDKSTNRSVKSSIFGKKYIFESEGKKEYLGNSLIPLLFYSYVHRL